MYEFLTGPMLWAAFLIFVIGLARRVVLYIRGLDWRLERVAYGPGRKIGMKGAISSVLQWLVPFGTHSWRRQPYFTIAFFLFHIGVVIVPLFLAGHMVIMQERFGFSLPSLPMWFSDAFTVLAIVGAGSPLPDDAGRLGYPVAGAVRARRRIPRPYAGPRL